MVLVVHVDALPRGDIALRRGDIATVLTCLCSPLALLNTENSRSTCPPRAKMKTKLVKEGIDVNSLH